MDPKYNIINVLHCTYVISYGSNPLLPNFQLIHMLIAGRIWIISIHGHYQNFPELQACQALTV